MFIRLILLITLLSNSVLCDFNNSLVKLVEFEVPLWNTNVNSIKVIFQNNNEIITKSNYKDSKLDQIAQFQVREWKSQLYESMIPTLVSTLTFSDEICNSVISKIKNGDDVWFVYINSFRKGFYCASNDSVFNDVEYHLRNIREDDMMAGFCVSVSDQIQVIYQREDVPGSAYLNCKCAK